MLLTHAQVVVTLEQKVGKERLHIWPDYSSSSHPPNPLDTPEYWQISYDNCMMATLYNENYRRPIPAISTRKRSGGNLPLPLVGVEPQLKSDNPLLYSALEELTNGRIYDASAVHRAQLRVLRVVLQESA